MHVLHIVMTRVFKTLHPSLWAAVLHVGQQYSLLFDNQVSLTHFLEEAQLTDQARMNRPC